jgi:hypothetical protein
MSTASTRRLITRLLAGWGQAFLAADQAPLLRPPVALS